MPDFFTAATFFHESDGSAFAIGSVFHGDTFEYSAAAGPLVDLTLNAATGDFTVNSAPVPVPPTWLLLLSGLGVTAVGAGRRRPGKRALAV